MRKGERTIILGRDNRVCTGPAAKEQEVTPELGLEKVSTFLFLSSRDKERQQGDWSSPQDRER